MPLKMMKLSNGPLMPCLKGCASLSFRLETGKYLNPSSWRCSMVWSAYMGLPLSLESVGAVLGLEKQKLTEGKI